MCIVIDVNCLADVFNDDNINHSKFIPIYNWINNGNGKVVYGGTKYEEELSLMPNYVRIIRRLNDARKTRRIDNEVVDAEELYVKSLEPNSRDFDDPHLIAIVRATGCKLICTEEKRAIKYISDKKFYKKSTDRPSIYRNATHKHLLSKKNICACCK